MNVLLTNSTDIFAGGEDYVLILARHLARRGHQVTVSANPGHLLLQKCDVAGLPILPIVYEGMGRVMEVGGILRKHIRRLAIDVVHSNANYDRTASAIGALGTRAVHVASVHSAHSIQYNITHWLRNRYAIDHFVADAAAVRDVLAHEDGIPDERISVVPIGVEPADLEAASVLRARTRTELGVGPHTVVIGNVARLVPFKGHRVLLEAIAETLKYRQDFLVAIVGDGELLEDLRDLARNLGVAAHVRFLGFRDDLEALYAGFDVYCHSSLELAAEAFPLAILRALAASLPVVCTDVGGIRMMVEEGVTGYLRPPDAPAALAEALVRVIRDADLRSSMGSAAESLFQRKFHAAAMAEAMEKIYERVRAR